MLCVSCYMTIRTRFAPSPTGYLHIGGLRTALFAYLTAKSQNGQCLLRIEDTDQKRLVPGSVEKLLEILAWAGIEFDEGPHAGGGHGPYTQSERRQIYDKYAIELLESGNAYRCFCTAERLQKMREGQKARKLPARYDRRCRGLSEEDINKKIEAGKPFVIRQKMPLDGEVKPLDELRGEIVFKAAELEDHVLIKSDGMPTYQFANVVDDHLMEISHVTRAEEWIPSLPKNWLLYEAFGWTPPKFIHLPVVLNKGGGKLSKRRGDVSVEDFRDKGYLAEALINFNALLGWSPYNESNTDNEILSFDKLIDKFNYKKINTSPAVFDVEKLDYFNGYYIRQKHIDELLPLCKPFLRQNFDLTDQNRKKEDEFLRGCIRLEQERMKKLSDITESTAFLFKDELELDPAIIPWKKSTPPDAKANLEKITELIKDIPEDNWTAASLEDAVYGYLKAKELKVGEYLWPMRVALSGLKASPGPYEIAEVLGRAETLQRIKAAISILEK